MWSLERTMRLLAVMEKSSRFPRQFRRWAELDQVQFRKGAVMPNAAKSSFLCGGHYWLVNYQGGGAVVAQCGYDQD